MNVAVLGASNKPDRYSYQAVKLLQEEGHEPYPVHPAVPDIDGIRAFPSLRDIPGPIHTISVYLSAANQARVEKDILGIGAQRIIFNPGAENPDLARRAREAGMTAMDACTLVLLRTGQFES